MYDINRYFDLPIAKYNFVLPTSNIRSVSNYSKWKITLYFGTSGFGQPNLNKLDSENVLERLHCKTIFSYKYNS